MKILVSRTDDEALQQMELERYLRSKYRVAARKGPKKHGETPFYRTYYTLKSKGTNTGKPPD